MGKSERRAKDTAAAARMKEQGVTRRCGACPNHCGAQVPVGGSALASHLNNCKGRRHK